MLHTIPHNLSHVTHYSSYHKNNDSKKFKLKDEENI